MMKSNESIIIQARLGSTRLPKKVLLPLSINETCCIIYMVSRLQSKLKIPIIVAIPSSKSDDELFQILRSNNITSFRGSEKDLITRYLECAKFYGIKIIVRLTADCPLVDPELIKDMLLTFSKENLDYIGNTTPPNLSTFPDGSDIEIFTLSALEKANYEESCPKRREHVTFQFWQDINKYRVKRYDQQSNFSNLRYTLDNPEDYTVIKSIIDHFGTANYFSHHDIQDFLKHKSELTEINKMYKPGDNW